MRGSERELVAFAGHGDVDDVAAVLTFSDPREDDRSRPRDEEGAQLRGVGKRSSSAASPQRHW